MKKALLFFLLALVGFSYPVNVHVFYGEGCPHCAALLNYLSSLQQEFPELKVSKFEVYHNSSNLEKFYKYAEAYGIEVEGVPTYFIGDRAFIGYSSSMKEGIREVIEECAASGCVDPWDFVTKNMSSSQVSYSKEVSPTSFKKGLTLALVVTAAAVDAINPCAFAVLIILLTTVLAAGTKKKVLFSGLAFTIAVYISYFLMGLGIFTAVQLTGLTYYFYKAVGFLALVVGLFNLKDFFKFGAFGFVMEVPRSWRPTMKRIIRSVVSVPGAFIVGLIVSLFLLPCTSGPYLVILGLLARQATRAYAIPWLLLYNAVFVLPMILITAAVYFGIAKTEEAEKWRQKKLRVLHLIAGIIMILMGVVLLSGVVM